MLQWLYDPLRHLTSCFFSQKVALCSLTEMGASSYNGSVPGWEKEERRGTKDLFPDILRVRKQ